MTYRTDLAHIHDAGFGDLAVDAARTLLDALQRQGFAGGTVVDLGCGSGITARHLVDAGYDVVGLDLSADMIAIARRRVPEGTFRVGSFVGAELPPCVAVCAVGEVLSYAFDERNDSAARTELFAGVHAVLEAGGLFLLDVAGPQRGSGDSRRTFVEDREWAVLVERSVEDRVLTRQITTFRRRGELYRRDSETHRLHLVSPEAIEAELEACGFEVERVEAYGSRSLPVGWHAFMARKRR